MKKVLFLLILLAITGIVTAQHLAPIDLLKDQKNINGYTVRLIMAQPKGYGFDILKDDKRIVHQFQNPIPFSSPGIQKKEDAYVIAQWMTIEYAKNGHWPNMVPPKVAKELNIQTH